MRLAWVMCSGLSPKGTMLLGLACVVGLAVRVWGLGVIPGGLNHDQTDVVLIARSFLAKGEDPQGNKLPVALVKRQIEMGDDTVLSLFLVPTEALHMGLFGARLPLVVINLVTAALVGLLARNLRLTRRIAVLASLVFWWSPWSIAFTRADVQAPLAIMLILTAINLVLRGKWGFVVFCALTWLCYYGFRPLLLIAVPLLILWRVKNKFVTGGVWAGFVIGYLVIVSVVPESTLAKRLGESPFNNLEKYAVEVNALRKAAIDNPLTPIFVNKYILLERDLIKNYLGAFGPDFLVWYGDERAVYRFGNHGVLYIIDVPLILVAITGFTNPLLWMLAIIAPVGTMLSTSEMSHIYRASLLLPLLSIIIAVGINKWWRYRSIIVAIYIVSVVNFLSFYFFHYPVEAGELTGVSERVVVNYLIRSPQTCVNALFPGQFAQQYAFYAGVKSLENRMCETLIIQTGLDGLPKELDAVIQDQKDAGVTWRVYNDQLCKNYQLDSWRRFNYLSDYAIEDMTDEQFCRRWLFAGS